MHTLEDLVTQNEKSLTNYRSLFAEQRSNLLLVAGNHYNRKGSRFWQNLRRMETISKDQKIRITKNHVQRITKGYVNALLRYSPNVGVSPRQESELQDAKAAELYSSVWKDIQLKQKFRKKRRQFVKDFVEIGETFCKVFFDPNQGQFIGYEPEFDEDGQVVIGADGNPVARKVFSGATVLERIHGFNLLSDPDARSWEEVRWATYQKMVPIKDLKSIPGLDIEALENITSSSEQTHKIFDATSGTYTDSKGLTILYETYFKPCDDYPNGYYYIYTRSQILFEGELPLGIFPIFYAGFDEASTSARSYSIIKQIRPMQAECNRCASKIAEHQITLGDDKILLLNGSSMSAGKSVHGIKGINVTGQSPQVMGGRTGEQYVSYMQSNISEMYQISLIDEQGLDKLDQNADPLQALFKTAKDKEKFSFYVEKIEDFFVEICDASLRYSKEFLSDEALIPVIGKKQYVNVDEFRNSDDLCYMVVPEPQTDDLESKMGRLISINTVLQYVGSNLDKSEIGKLIRNYPYLNKEEMFNDFTIDYDNATNDILRLDRGQWVEPRKNENHEYMSKRLVARTKMADFEFLNPQIQQMYERKIQMHDQIHSENLMRLKELESEFIPSGGMITTIDMYVPDPRDPTKQKKAKVPAEAVNWLLDKLAKQGTSQQMIEALDPSSSAGIAEQYFSAMSQQGMPNQAAMGGQFY